MRARALVAALGLLATACTGGDGDQAAIVEFAGTVEYHTAEGWQPAGDSVPADARVRVVGEGSFVLLEHALGQLFLTTADGDEAAEALLSLEAIDLEYGDLGVALADGRSVTVRDADAGLTVISDAGTIRVAEGVSTRVAAYAGSAVATVIDRDLFVPAWHEASLRAGELPDATVPVLLRDDDPVDQFAAGEVLALDAELEALRRGYEAEFGVRIRAIGELDAIARDAARQPFTFVQPVLADWRSGDVLIGVVVALLLEASEVGDLPQMFNRVHRLFDQGASWGVIAAIHGFTPDTIVDRVSRAVALRSGDVEPGEGEPINEPPPRTEPTAFPRPTSSPAPSPTATSTPTRSPTPTPTDSPTPTNSPSPTPTNSPSPTPSPTITPPTETPSPTLPPPPSGSCDPIDQIFGTC